MKTSYGPILVVEDAINVLEMLETVLKLKGYTVMTAQNGQEALEKINRARPALIITDVLMPKMDGYALAHALHQDTSLATIPILFMSATYAAPEDKDFAYDLGAIRFLEKPIDTEDFLLTVAEILIQGPEPSNVKIGEQEFQRGYRERLESKLRSKNTQIARTERLLQALPDEQKPAFETLLSEALEDRRMIREELDQLEQMMRLPNPSEPDQPDSGRATKPEV